MEMTKKDYIMIGITVLMMSSLCYWVIRKDEARYNNAVEHIKVVTLTDKNCNDCHLGASFVNLFNHAAVKSNDNVVTLMMDKAKIKRW